MNKAVLVMDMPESCEECNFLYFNGDNCKDSCQAYEVAKPVDSDTYEKPDWCPLRELPERMEICGTYNAEYYAKGGLMPSYKLGWNKCLDAIEGDADKTDD